MCSGALASMAIPLISSSSFDHTVPAITALVHMGLGAGSVTGKIRSAIAPSKRK